MKTSIFAILTILSCSLTGWADVKVKDVSFSTRWPWNGKVDITFTIGGTDIEGRKYNLSFKGYDNVTQKSITMTTITGVGWTYGRPVHSGTLHAVWNAAEDCSEFNSTAFQIKVSAAEDASTAGMDVSAYPYIVVDLSSGANSLFYPYELSYVPPTSVNEILNSKTSQLWLKKIPGGVFSMGSHADEVGRHSNETPHLTALTKEFFVGLYETTQSQWELVMGSNPSQHVGTLRPVESVSYEMIRGAQNGAQWPAKPYQADDLSFMGRLQQRTGLTLDLPTEAQWEYACRAGTTTYLNNGDFQIIEKFCDYNDNSRFVYYYEPELMDITNYNLGLLSAVARWDYNRGDGKGSNAYTQHTIVGSYDANAWGLFDMHGNLYEWCLDWMGSYPSGETTDPVGPLFGTNRVCRGGSWKESDCDKFRSAFRSSHKAEHKSSELGFRIVWHRVN